jgi:hypothetical protein
MWNSDCVLGLVFIFETLSARKDIYLTQLQTLISSPFL